MPLVEMKCPNCGGILKEDLTKEAAICSYCGTPFVVEKAIQNFNTTVINNTINNITADKVVISPEKDFVIQAGTLIKYRGASTVVHIPEGVKKIKYNAFENCGYMMDITELYIPSTVVEIEYDHLGIRPEKVSISDKNTKYHSLENSIIDTKTKRLIYAGPNGVIPNDGGVTSIGSYAFRGRRDLTEITIPDGVTSIESGAFEGCENLKNIFLPDSITSIGSYAFCACRSLESVILPPNITNIDSGLFKNCSGLKSITIPPSVTSLGGHVFEGCNSLKSITIPPSVTSLELDVFKGCESLEELTLPGGCQKGAIRHTEFWKLFGHESSYGAGLPKSFKTLVINGGNIEAHEFRGCCTITCVKILDGVTRIGRWAFNDCSSITTIMLPSSLTSIGYGAFDGCVGLKNITIPSSVTHIGGSAFSRCRSLTEITIPSSVTTIEGNLFYVFDGRKIFQHKKPKKCLNCGEKMPIFSKKCKCGVEYIKKL